ncbi:MAG: DUF559 domain-containing protein [Bacteroidales bacterium]|nr:DUF559 domain-containing protein [Bacteroidales bacterium]
MTTICKPVEKRHEKGEACLWKYVLRSHMMLGYQFRRQRPVLNYLADFMCKELKLIIEVDGGSHNDDEIYRNDLKRQGELEKAGFTVLRFSDEEVLKNINNVTRTLEGWIEEFRKKNPPPAPSSGG